MKRIKLLPSVLMLALCIGILGIGIYAATPTNNVITGTITVNAANAGIKVEVFEGQDTTGTKKGEATGRTQTEIDLQNIAIDASNALTLEDVPTKYYTIRFSTTSTHKFVVDTETIQLVNGIVTETSATKEDAIIITKNHKTYQEDNGEGGTGLAYFTAGTGNEYVITCAIKLGELPEQAFTASFDMVFDVYKLEDWVEEGNTGINGVDYLYYGSYPQTLAAEFDAEGEITGYTKVANETFGGYDTATKQFVERDVYTKDGETDGTKYVLLTFETKWVATERETLATACKKLFKIEPLRWNILERNQTTGKAKLMCDTIVEGVYFQQYFKTQSIMTGDGGWDNFSYATESEDGGVLQENGKDAYANNYNVSTLRKYLTETFYTGAFNNAEELLILQELVDNTNSTETGAEANTYSCQDTYDKVFALSYQEVLNTNYKFGNDLDNTDIQKMVTSSDFAISTGVFSFTLERFEQSFGASDKETIMDYIESEIGLTGDTAEKFYNSLLNSGCWWLRSPSRSGYYQSNADCIATNGTGSNRQVDYGDVGCVPAMVIGL